MRDKLVLLEFNELCPSLLQQWMAAGDLPNFKKFFNESDSFVTVADEPEGANLEPWIQWYSMHTGLSFQQHKVFHLTDGPGAGHDDIWQVLRRHGKGVGNFSSMNAKRFDGERSFYVPDPWCTSQRAFPDELNRFHRVVGKKVQEYSNSSDSLGMKDYTEFLSFLVTHGLRPTTVLAILRTLAEEVTSRGGGGWKRAVLLDKLQYDVFACYMRKYQPDFATFFINSTAHYQHSFWRHMAPEAFVNKPGETERARYKDAILFGYQQMDRLLGDFFKLEADGITLILATALSQQPYLKYESIGGHNFYRPRNIEALLQRLGIDYSAVYPVMTHQYVVHFDQPKAMEAARVRIGDLTYEGAPVFEIQPGVENSIYIGNQVRTRLPEDAQMQDARMPGQSLPYFGTFYRIDGIKSGRHHPDGVLWFKGGRRAEHSDKISILDVFPTLLEHYDVELPRNNRFSYEGKSVYGQLAA